MNKPIKITDLEKFKLENTVSEIIDKYEYLLDELFQIRNPWTKMKKDYSHELEIFTKDHLVGKNTDEAGEWFYFPWNKIIMHCLPDLLHQEILTARNKNIITENEQEKLHDTIIAIAGLSVGSHAALIMSMMGIASHIKLADPDEISPSNLNRLNYDFTKVGKNKAETVAEYIYQRNPYSTIEVFSEGVTTENIDNFLSDVDILVEEMDNLPMKVMIRKKAKSFGIPVLMATDNGNGVILDIERFDENSDHPLFHGRIEFSEENLSPVARQANPKLWNKIASEIIGIEFMEENLLNSLTEIGQTLGGIPQLGAAATISGALIAVSVSRIVTQKPLPSGKYIFSTDAILDPNYQSTSSVESRNNTRTSFMKFLNS